MLTGERLFSTRSQDVEREREKTFSIQAKTTSPGFQQHVTTLKQY